VLGARRRVRVAGGAVRALSRDSDVRALHQRLSSCSGRAQSELDGGRLAGENDDEAAVDRGEVEA
jgi:hypothetical protein